ncbi:MAG: hypothetical protein VB106_14020 [Clostridiaceae bacterium]|nr:hypothetical protein [Clostridiaceae bacterium]
MKLTNIVNLHNQMRKEKLYRQRFDFEYNKVKADVFFLIDDSPYILLFGVKTKNIYFEIEMYNGFYINDGVDNDTYDMLLIYNLVKIMYSDL